MFVSTTAAQYAEDLKVHEKDENQDILEYVNAGCRRVKDTAEISSLQTFETLRAEVQAEAKQITSVSL